MREGRPDRFRRSRAGLVVVLLVFTLGLFAVLAYEAWQAARSHRATAESTLVDYARFAAWELARSAERRLDLAIYLPLRPMTEGSLAGEAMPDPSEPVEPPCDCAVVQPRAYFRLDLERNEAVIRTRRDGAATTLPDRLRRRIASHAHRVYEASAPQATMIRRGDDGRTDVVAYHVRPAVDGGSRTAYGLIADLAALRPVLEEAADSTTLLPPSITRGLDVDSLLAVRVHAEGQSVYRSAVDYGSSYTAIDTLARRFGDLTVRLTLRPEMAERLVIGGLPGSRLPLLLGLMALAAGLVLVALHQLRRQHQLARLRADFVSSTSHELRTPLAQIRMFAEMLLLGRVRSEEERTRALEVIVQEAKRLTHMVANVLLVSRSERREMSIEREPTDIGSLVDDVVGAFEPLARARKVEIDVAVDQGLAAAIDSDAIRQVLLNLLDNAVKYGDAGQRVTVEAVHAEGRLVLRVDDEGPGVPDEERERIFGSFRRLERDVESAAAGSGVGLAVVRKLVDLHEGRTWVEDSPRGGARFVVEIPDAWPGREHGDGGTGHNTVDRDDPSAERATKPGKGSVARGRRPA